MDKAFPQKNAAYDAYADSFYLTQPDASLHLLYAGKHVCPPGHRYGGVRDHVLTHYVCSGEGTVYVNRKEYCLEKGDAFTFFPGQHHMYQASKEHPWTYVWAGYCGGPVNELLKRGGITPEFPVFKAEFQTSLQRLFEKAFACLEEKKKGHSVYADGLLHLILSCFIEHGAGNNGPKSAQNKQAGYVEKAVEFMRVNYNRQISAQKVAAHIGYNRSYFSWLFKKEKGISLKDFLLQYRVQRAKTLLRTSPHSVGSIAFSVGYRDYFVFAKMFKKQTGLTPTRYREHMHRKPHAR